MKLYNKFTIGVVFDIESQCDKLKERLETVVDDLDVTKRNVKGDDDDDHTYYELILKCDTGTSTLVSGTRIRWDSTDDPEDDETVANFINWLKDFPL